MTITSFDDDIPDSFLKEPSMDGRLSIFLRYVACKIYRKDMIKNELEKISIMIREGDKHVCEVYFDKEIIGVIKLIEATADFIFTPK